MFRSSDDHKFFGTYFAYCSMNETMKYRSSTALTALLLSSFAFTATVAKDQSKKSNIQLTNIATTTRNVASTDASFAVNRIDVQPYIVGGHEAVAGNQPWMVACYFDSGGDLQYVCGGTLVAPNIVLSAAHCADYIDVVKIGVSDPFHENGEDFEEFKVEEILIHPQYDDVTVDNDFLLVKLDGISKYRPIKVDDGTLPSDHSAGGVSVLGWGLTSADAQTSSSLQQIDLYVVPSEDCNAENNWHGKITENMMCAYAADKSACYGDSGGPLVTSTSTGEVVQMGVISWGGKDCSGPKPNIFARVNAAYDWIASYICDVSVNYCMEELLAPALNTIRPTQSPSQITSIMPSSKPSRFSSNSVSNTPSLVQSSCHDNPEKQQLCQKLSKKMAKNLEQGKWACEKHDKSGNDCPITCGTCPNSLRNGVSYIPSVAPVGPSKSPSAAALDFSPCEKNNVSKECKKQRKKPKTEKERRHKQK